MRALETHTHTHTGQLYTVTLAAHARRGLTKQFLLQIAQSNEAGDTSEENMKLNVKGKFSRLSTEIFNKDLLVQPSWMESFLGAL